MNTADRTRRQAISEVTVGAAGLALGLAAGPALAQPVPGAIDALLTAPGGADAFHASVSARLGPKAVALAQATKAWGVAVPGQATRALEQAKFALDGMLQLPGTGGKRAFVGNPIPWNKNPTDALEYIVTLNRTEHWQALLTAWMLTGEDRYVAKVVTELDSWIATCPPPATTSDLKVFSAFVPWRLLETGIRMFESWASVVKTLAGTKWLPADRLARLGVTVHTHCRFLAEVAPKLWPKADHNHYLMEMTGLLSAAALYPEFKASAEWKAQAWREVARCAEAQLTREGGQVEGTPHYHNLCVLFFCKALRVGRAEGLPLDAAFRARVMGSLLYSLHATRPDGNNVPWGDSDCQRSTVDSLVAASEALDFWGPLAVLKTMVGPDPIMWAANKIVTQANEPAAWIAKVRALKPASTERVFWARELDQAMMRTEWFTNASSVFFGCHTPVNNGHAHMDPASFDYCAFGRAIIVDPGRYTYVDNQDRRDFKSATRHNTLTINDREPFEYRDSFNFGPQKPGKIVQRYALPGLTAFEAVNQNYDPVYHLRLLALLDAGDLVIVDVIDGLKAGDKAQLWFHFDTLAVGWDAGKNAATTRDVAKANAALSVSPGLAGTMLDGFVSDSIDQRRPSKRLCLESASGPSTRAFVTHIRPGAKGTPIAPVVAAPTIDPNGSVAFTIEGRGKLVWTAGKGLVAA